MADIRQWRMLRSNKHLLLAGAAVLEELVFVRLDDSMVRAGLWLAWRVLARGRSASR